MQVQKRPRGRPKGSGIDDSAHLMKIAGLIAANPGMKRTTAIKAIGIDNPSHIRRLRDKFAAEEAKLIRAARKAMRSGGGAAALNGAAGAAASVKGKAKTKAATAKASKAKAKGSAKASARTAASKAAKTKAKAGAATAKASAKTAKAAKSKAGGKTATKAKTRAKAKTNGKAPMIGGVDLSAAKWLGSNFDTVVTSMVEQQIQLYESAVKYSPLATLLRQQAFLTDMMLTMLKAQKKFSGMGK